MTIKEVDIRQGVIRFDTIDGSYLAEFVHPSPDAPGLVRNENMWKLRKFTYHSTRYDQPVQVSRENQRPRFEGIGHYSTVQECREQIERLLEE